MAVILAMIGALAGVVVNHNIVLIDTFHRHLKSGMEPIEAVVRSGAQRLRPVFLTTITAIGGLIPMMYAVEIDFWKRSVTIGSVNAMMWIQISTAIIFGLAFSKLSTLGLIPAMLALPYRVREKHGSFFAMYWHWAQAIGRAFRRLFGAARGGAAADGAPAE